MERAGEGHHAHVLDDFRRRLRRPPDSNENDRSDGWYLVLKQIIVIYFRLFSQLYSFAQCLQCYLARGSVCSTYAARNIDGRVRCPRRVTITVTGR